MQIQKILFINRAPFEHLELDFKLNGINVLSAINGKGKTTIISHIVDAFHELAREAYPLTYEGKEKKYYRISSSLFNIDRLKYSLVYIRFTEDNDQVDYIDCYGAITKEEFKSIVPDIHIDYDRLKNILDNAPCAKIVSRNCNKMKIEHIYENNVITYFPAYRYELPVYLNDPYKQTYHFKQEAVWGGVLPNPIEVITGMRYLSNWILDVVLDGEVYSRFHSYKMSDGSIRNVDVTPEKLLLGNVNHVISNILSSKGYGGLKFAIGKRNNGGQRVCIATADGKRSVVPNIYCLSSGEAALLCVFGEILRQADNLNINIEPINIKGIVLIDEVEKHLHITLQKEILPKLLTMFPNVQFIISSHSPFLNMGLAETIKERSLLIDLDNNGISIAPEENGLYKEVYEIMTKENQRYADQVTSLSKSVEKIKRPIIITEGKTDWKHLEAALSYFKNTGEYADLDIEIVEYDFDFGDSKLDKLLCQYGKFPQRYPIIGVFDCDEANGKDIRKNGGIKNYGNNVWGISIDIPPHRNYNKSGISIEFLYQDDDLKKEEYKTHRRLYVTSEFNENGRLVANLQIGVKNNHDVNKYTDRSQEKIQCDGVIDLQGNSLALSKEQFALNILNKIDPFDKMDFDAFHSVFDKIKGLFLNKL